MPDSRIIGDFELQILTHNVAGKIGELIGAPGFPAHLLTVVRVSLETAAEEGRGADSRMEILAAISGLLTSTEYESQLGIADVTTRVVQLHQAWFAFGEAARLQAAVDKVSGSSSTSVAVFAALTGLATKIGGHCDSGIKAVAALREYTGQRHTA